MTSEEIEQFLTRGYVALSHFFTAQETAAMQAEVDRLKREGLLRNVATEGDGITTSARKQNLQLCPMYPHSRLFRAVPFVPKVQEAISQLIGDPVILRLDQVFLKPAKNGAGTNWHQDNAYFKIQDPLKGTAMWVAVHDATVANGTLHVIPASFLEMLQHTRDPDSDHHIRCFPDEAKAVPIELPAGGVVFFSYGTPHATLGNSTERDRAGAAFHFVQGDSFYEDPALRVGGNPNYHPVLSGPEATGGRKEYGEKIEGTWELEVDRALDM